MDFTFIPLDFADRGKKHILITLAGYFKLVALWTEILPHLYPLTN